jgi:P22_AR N-terminal domain/ORF6C domain
MEKETALIPIDERIIDFYGDEITTALVSIENQSLIYIPLRPICEYLGLSWSGQRERVNRDPVLSGEARFVRVTRTNLGGNPNILCLPLDFINGFLFGMNASRVKPELQEKVIRYQRECYRILAETFQAESSLTHESSDAIAALEQIRDMGLAIAHMAEQQIEMEQRLNARLDRAASVVGDIQRRLTVVERRFHPQALISDEQAEEISSTVKALAELLTSHDPSKKNHYQGIFAELYRRFGVSSYKNIRLEHYEKVLQFLEDWRKSAETRAERG